MFPSKPVMAILSIVASEMMSSQYSMFILTSVICLPTSTTQSSFRTPNFCTYQKNMRLPMRKKLTSYHQCIALNLSSINEGSQNYITTPQTR